MLRTQPKSLLLITVATLLGQFASVAFWIPGTDMRMIWVPGAVLLCALSFNRYTLWPACLLGAIAGSATALAFLGVPWVQLLVIVLADCALVTVAATLLRRYGREHLRLDGFGEMARFVMLAGVALPALSAWLVVGVFDNGAPLGLAGPWFNIAMAHSLGYLLIVPTVTNILWAIREPVRRRHYPPRLLIATLLLIVATWYVWYVNWHNSVATHLLVMVPIPLLIWSLIAFGMAGACAALLLVTLMGMTLSVLGNGPFSSMTPTDMVFCVQAWALCLAIPGLFLGAFAEQKFSASVKLGAAYRNLTEVTSRMLAVQEEERTRIARDLHDGINQSLAAISIELSALKRVASPDHSPTIHSIQEQMLAVSNDIRSISHELHPSVLRFTGLSTALNSFCEKHNAKDQFRIFCILDEVPFLTDAQELGIFRIVQEAVANIERHAHASNARVILQVHADNVNLAIEDDGIGIATSQAFTRKGLGMISMQERARLLGGKFTIEALSGGGTRVSVNFPSGTTAGL